MSDERLRELERRARETGAADDQAAWLVERLRMARLTRRRLEAAAHCGHEGARLALGTKAPLPEPTRDWARRLAEPGDRELTVVALTAIGRCLLEHCDGLTTDDGQRERVALQRALLASIHAWRTSPGPDAREGVLQAARARLHGPITPRTPIDWALQGAHTALGRAVDAIKSDDPDQHLRLASEGLGSACELGRRELLPAKLLVPAVCADVLAWALADGP